MIKTAIVTGGTKGIGFGVAEALIKEGIQVAITGRDKKTVDEATRKLNEIKSGLALGIVADVRSLDSQNLMVQEVVNKFGGVNYFIANAGIGHFATIQDMTDEQWHETIDTNLTGVFYGIKAVHPALKKSEGYFITISSLAGTNFFAQGAAYNASKFGLVGFSQAIMLDLRKDKINVTTIMPGSVATNFNNHEVNDADSWKIQPEDIGRLVVDLIKMPSRTLPSKIEVRPSQPQS